MVPLDEAGRAEIRGRQSGIPDPGFCENDSQISIPDPRFSKPIPNPHSRSQIYKIPGILGFIADPWLRSKGMLMSTPSSASPFLEFESYDQIIVS